jgi:hypothetical protein
VLKPTPEVCAALAYLRSPDAIRERCGEILELACAGRLHHFAYDPANLTGVTDEVVAITRETYPTLDIPLHSRWRHFNAGGIDRLQWLTHAFAALSRDAQARCRFELVITSVLLDAGAGAQWAYREVDSDTVYTRSEGLAIASLHLFLNGGFASQTDDPWRADATGLQHMTQARLADALQVTPDNPLVGLQGRVTLLRQLGRAVTATPEVFGETAPRLGHLYDYLCAQTTDGVLPARIILKVLLERLSPIWPHRMTLAGTNLGDVWRHSQVAPTATDRTAGLVPFHKLSQWLTYSLIEPLQEAGVQVVEIDALTGLAEYRNGGLLLDCGVLTPKREAILSQEHAPESKVIVEWRALTVALLDQVAQRVRATLGTTAAELPLGSVLEGGTWRAGRRVAARLRPDGSPPLRLASDATVF